MLITNVLFGGGCVKLNHLIYVVLSCVWFCVSTSCHSHDDEPDIPMTGEAPVEVALDLDTAMIAFDDMDVDSRAGSAAELRCQVRAYALNAQDALVGAPVGQATVYFTTAGQRGDCRMTLPSGRYCLLAWADYVDAGSQADKFYDTADLTDITLRLPYVGNTHLRNAYSGMAQVDFSVPEGDSTTVVNAPLALRSVMGKVMFVATDYAEFVAGTPQPLRVLVSYTGFLPSRYSVLRGVPFDSSTGIQFLTEMATPATSGATQVTLASDYVMVNGEQASVTAALGLYADDGHLVATSGSLNIPIRRGGVTRVMGRFLTRTQSGGGIGIDPDFAGDITIVI